MEMALRERWGGGTKGWGRVGVLLGGAAESERLTRVKILTIECDFRILALALSWNLGFFRRPGNRLEFTISGLSISKHRIGLASLRLARLGSAQTPYV